MIFFEIITDTATDLRKKNRCTKFSSSRPSFLLSRRLHFRNSNGTIKTWKKFHSSAQSSSPQFSKLFLSFLFFFLFSFFRKSAAVSAIIPKKIIAAFIPLRKYECHSRATRRSKRTFPPPNLPFEAWQARRVHNLNFSRELPAKS